MGQGQRIVAHRAAGSGTFVTAHYVVIVTHEGEAAAVAYRVLQLEDGRLSV